MLSDAFSSEVGNNHQIDADWWNVATRLEREQAMSRYSRLQLWNEPSVKRPFGSGPRETLKEMLDLPSQTVRGLRYAPMRPAPLSGASEWSDGAWRKAKRTRIQKSDDDIRDIALKRLKELILEDPWATELGRTLLRESGEMDSKDMVCRSVMDAFSRKASTTIQKRVGALCSFWTWCKARNVPVLSPSEAEVYAYLRFLESKQVGASAATQFVEAWRFLDGTVTLLKAPNNLLSARVLGLAHKLFLTKKPLSQKDHVQGKHVTALEMMMVKTKDSIKQCVLGQLLFCFHAAARWSDAQRLVRVDSSEKDGIVLLEAQGLGSKTTLSKEAKTRFLPFVAIGSGLSDTDWAHPWLEARSLQEWNLSSGFLPSFSMKMGRWSETQMSTSEASAYLKDFLEEAGFDQEEMQNLGTHSLKAGLLTMASRSQSVSFSFEERRQLGHHVDPNQKSLLTYSREGYVKLYGKVLAMFKDYQAGAFQPDLSAIDRLVQTAEFLNSESTETGQEQIADDSESSEGQQTVVVPLEEPKKQRKVFEEKDNDECVIHKLSGIVHMLDTETSTLCGRRVTNNFLRLSAIDIPDDDLDCCFQCSTRLAADIKRN